MENPFIITDHFDGNIVDQDNNKYDALYINRELVDSVTSRGFDSIIIKCEKGYNQYVVFNPNQIKSIDNNGDFGLDTNNIFK